MDVLVLGGGLQGSACAYDLLRQDDVATVTVADRADAARRDYLPVEPRLRAVSLDVRDEAAVRDQLDAHDVALSAAPYYLNADLARLAVEAGCHFSDLGGNTDIVFEQMELDEAAREAGCTVVPDVGLAPGMVDVLAAAGVRALDETRSVRMYVGGLPQRPSPPLDYQVVYSLEGTLDYYTTPSSIVRDGVRRQIDALSEVERIEVPEIGTLEAFHTGGGASTLPWRYEGRVEELEYKTLRYPGHADVMRAIRDLGLLDRDPVRVDSTEVRPRDVFIACASPRLTRPDEPDLVALRVVCEGRRDGEPVTLAWELIDREDEEAGITAMMRCTGYTLAIVGLMLGRGTIAERGVLPPDVAIPLDPYLEALAERGIRIRFEERAGTGSGVVG